MATCCLPGAIRFLSSNHRVDNQPVQTISLTSCPYRQPDWCNGRWVLRPVPSVWLKAAEEHHRTDPSCCLSVCGREGVPRAFYAVSFCNITCSQKETTSCQILSLPSMAFTTPGRKKSGSTDASRARRANTIPVNSMN